jgi:predicted SAM-dependent methyltransferase
MTKISLNRSITDYTKVQGFIGRIIRCKSFFINSNKIKKSEYLDIGCGPNINNNFVNLEYSWSPKIDVCWDLTKKELPFSSNSFKGVFTEHCFEHIPFDDFKKNMKEIYRILKPNGTLRLVMPDGEIYLDIYHKRKNGSNEKMPFEEGYISPMHRINGIFRNHGHQFIYDFETVKIILQEAGFKEITKAQFRIGRDNTLLRDTEFRADESLYVEAIK